MSDSSDLPLLVRFKKPLLVIGILLLLAGLALPAWAFVDSLSETFQDFDRSLETLDRPVPDAEAEAPSGMGSTFGMFLIGVTMIFAGTGAIIVSLATPSDDA